MKQLILLITLTFFYQAAFSQGVGINTTTPDPSAALDIQSSNKGLLVPRVALTSFVDGVTIANPSNALLVFNTTNNASLDPGYYYNSGTAASPSWKSLSELTFPFYKASSPAASAGFQIDNYNGQASAIAIKGYAAGDGTGIYAQSDNRFALQVEGKLKIFGNSQNPGLGKVLTSDQIGGATWQDAPKLPEVSFSATGIKGNGGEVIGQNTDTQILFATEEYDLGSNYNDLSAPVPGVFITPINGIYHFDVMISYSPPLGGANNRTFLRLNRVRTGTKINLVNNTFNATGDNSHTISVDISLQQGDEVNVSLVQVGFPLLNLDKFNNAAYFNGRLVNKQ